MHINNWCMSNFAESHNMHCETDNLSSEKGKRRLKTPTQVQALERFYNEHKYPSESMKLQFAKQIGLSEKQVSGWFCHRRSKDKKLLQDEGYANIKQNLSNGTIHDSASGLRQESCNSTKQVDMPFDGKEVESNMLQGQNISVAIPAQKGQSAHVRRYEVAEDRSSGSSTTSYEKLLKHGVDSCIMKHSYLNWDENYTLMDFKGGKKRERVMDTRSPYFQGYVESSHVSLVKLKLGAEYREDGPSLAVDFDPLPPGAFDSPIRDSNTVPYYVGDSVHPRSCSIRVIVGESKVHDKYRCQMVSSGSHMEGGGYDRKLRRFNHQSDVNGCQLIPTTSYSKNIEYGPNRTFITDEDGKGVAGDASDYYGINNLSYFRHRSTGISDNINSNLVHPNGLKANVNNQFVYSVPDHEYSAPMSQMELPTAQILKPTIKRRRKEFRNTEDIVQPRGTLKVLKKKIHKQNRLHENCSSAWPQMLMTTDSQVNRVIHGKYFRSNMLD